jgi:hypothetical protein
VKKYEYVTRIVELKAVMASMTKGADVSELDATLNEMGREGWELAEMTHHFNSVGNMRYLVFCVFKREIV